MPATPLQCSLDLLADTLDATTYHAWRTLRLAELEDAIDLARWAGADTRILEAKLSTIERCAAVSANIESFETEMP